MKPIDHVVKMEHKSKYCPHMQHRNLFEMMWNFAGDHYRCKLVKEGTEADTPCYASDWENCILNPKNKKPPLLPCKD